MVTPKQPRPGRLRFVQRDHRLKKLSWDHHHGLVMALRIERELADDGADWAGLYADLLSFWAAGLLPHFRTESECLLARLIRHVPDSDACVQRTQADHLGMAALVVTMRDTSDMVLRRNALRRFGMTLRDHIRWEESVLFALVQEKLASDELDALGADIAERLPDVIAAPARATDVNLAPGLAPMV